MLVVRNRFVAKPGCAGKLAAQLKEAVAAFEMPPDPHVTRLKPLPASIAALSRQNLRLRKFDRVINSEPN
jgi:hypothetical protein